MTRSCPSMRVNPYTETGPSRVHLYRIHTTMLTGRKANIRLSKPINWGGSVMVSPGVSTTHHVNRENDFVKKSTDAAERSFSLALGSRTDEANALFWIRINCQLFSARAVLQLAGLSIGCMGGEPPICICPIISKPCRSYSVIFRGLDDSR